MLAAKVEVTTNILFYKDADTLLDILKGRDLILPGTVFVS